MKYLIYLGKNEELFMTSQNSRLKSEWEKTCKEFKKIYENNEKIKTEREENNKHKGFVVGMGGHRIH